MRRVSSIVGLVCCFFLINSVVLGQGLTVSERIRAYGSVVQLKINGGEELGTGFTINSTGIIVTNQHVVANVDLENPDIVVAIYEVTQGLPRERFLARPLKVRNETLIFEDIDIAVLEIYAFLDGRPIVDLGASLRPMSYWNEDAQIADPVNLFGYPNITNNQIQFADGYITSVLSPIPNYASDTLFGEAGSGGPALSDSSELIGVARARAEDEDGNEFTVVIPLARICEAHKVVCDLLPNQDEQPADGPPARAVKAGGYLQCLNARGPSFNLGDRFVVPEGGDGTNVRRTPSWIINNQLVLLEEGEGGTIIQGPVCGPAAKGELIGWYVETDDGDKGWISEGYIFNVIPWIAKESQIDEWADFVPEDFVCPDSYGPNFQVGHRFTVPLGDGGTRLWVNPNRAPEADLIPEGTQGMILEGPICARGNGGLLVSWLVLTDTGLSGWASEGYNDSAAPWISPIVDQE